VPAPPPNTAHSSQPNYPNPHLQPRGFGSPHLSGPPPNLDKLFTADAFSVPFPRRKALRAPHRHAGQISRFNPGDPFG
jgi:hypothetical protein